MVHIEALQLIVSDAAGHCRDMVDIRFRHHGFHRCIHVPAGKLVLAVRIPKSA